MEEEYSVTDPIQLLEAASVFAHDPGFLSDASTRSSFSDSLFQSSSTVLVNYSAFHLAGMRFALQTKADVPGLENALVACLERIFGTKYGASLVPQYMVSCLLEYSDETSISAARLVVEYDVYPLLLKCLIDGDEQVATASTDVIRKFAGSPEGLGMVFPANVNEATHLRNVAAGCSSLPCYWLDMSAFISALEGRVRVLALIVKLFSISSSVASVVYNSNLLSLLEAELRNMKIHSNAQALKTSRKTRLCMKLAEIQHSTEFLSRTTLLQILVSLISNGSIGSILRARAMTIIGRLLSKEDVFTFIDESSVKTVISVIDGRLLESEDADEFECTVEALGQIGMTIQGATVLLSNTPPTARHVVDAAFDQHGRGKQLVALHALGNIAGEPRSESNRILNGLLLSVLQQESEIRLAAISKALLSSPKLTSDPALAGIAAKLDEAVRRGPYLAGKNSEAQPAVMTAERF
ncbi:hypothetical protein C3L33_10008, partial [Rhododendron williamsianum]